MSQIVDWEFEVEVGLLQERRTHVFGRVLDRLL